MLTPMANHPTPPMWQGSGNGARVQRQQDGHIHKPSDDGRKEWDGNVHDDAEER